MSERIGDTFVTYPEAAGKCELCGEMDELRPYGPNGENICFVCAMKDEETTRKQFRRLLDGVKTVIKIQIE